MAFLFACVFNVIISADAASTPVFTAVPYTGPDYWVRSSSSLAYTTDIDNVTWKGPKADNVTLYYIINGKEYFIVRARGDRNNYLWNIPDQPDPSQPSKMVFRNVQLKAVWQKKITSSTGKTTYQNLTTQFSDYFTIARPGAFLITTQELPDAYAGEAYSYDLRASGGEKPYHWYLKGGGYLPPGLTLSADGRITGTPTASTDTPFSFRCCVQDSGVDALQDELDLTLMILDRSATGTPAPAEPFDFTMSMGDYSNSTTVDRPATGQTTVHKTVDLRWNGGVKQTVTLDVTGCPTGMDCSFSPRTGMPGFTSAMNITVHNTLAPGTYPLVVHGRTDTGLDKTLSYTVIVTTETTAGDLILEDAYALEDGFEPRSCIMPVQVNDGLGWAIKGKNTIFRTTISSTFDTDMDVYVEIWLPVDDWSWENQTTASGRSIRTASMGTYNCPEHYVYGTTVTVPANGDVEITMPDPATLVNETVHSSAHRVYDEYTIVTNAPRPLHSGEDRASAPEYTIYIDPYDRVAEASEYNNFPADRGYESVLTHDSTSLNILYTPFLSDNYEVDDFWPGGVSGTAFANDFSDNITRQAKRSTEFMIAVYPVADEGKISYYLNPGLISYYPYGGSYAVDLIHLQSDLCDMAAENGYDRIVALVPHGWYTDSPDWGGVVWNHNPRASFVRINPNSSTTVTHENYHNLGYGDIDHFNSNHDFPADDGYWVNKQTVMDVSGSDLRDYMDYTNRTRWTTTERYYNVYNSVPRSDDPPMLLFRCLINKNGSLNLKPFMIVDGRQDVEPAGWTHKIVLKDSAGNVVREQMVFVSFNASLDYTDDFVAGKEIEVDESFISAMVPWSDNVALVELRDKGGALLASRAVSRNAPTVQFTEPRAGDVWEAGKTYTLKWNASDPDGDALAYSLAMSTDRATWIPVDIDLKSAEYSFDTKAVQPGDYYFRVRATDGVLSANDTMERSISVMGTSSLPSSGTATPTSTAGQAGLPGNVMVIGGVVAVVLVAIVLVAALLVMRPKK